MRPKFNFNKIETSDPSSKANMDLLDYSIKRQNSTKYGYFRGREVSILHYAQNELGDYQFPLLCQVRRGTGSSREYYMSILACKLKDGFRSQGISLDAPSKMKRSLYSFQRLCRYRLAMRRIRAKVRIRKLKEDLIAAVWHPKNMKRWLEIGGWPLVAMIAGDEGLA
jgi:hypothetical protein